MTTEKLNRNQEKFLVALMNSSSVVEASEQAGITTPTAYKYLNDDTFKAEHRRIRREAFEQATSKIVDSVEEAVEVLRTVMNDEDELGSTRVQASRVIIQNAFKSYELQEIEERMDNFEKTLEDMQP